MRPALIRDFLARVLARAIGPFLSLPRVRHAVTVAGRGADWVLPVAASTRVGVGNVEEGASLVGDAWRLACSMPPAPPLSAWEALETRALRGSGALRGSEIVRLLHACTVARRRPKRLLQQLAEEIPGKLSQFDAGGLCVCLHAYAQMRERQAALFASATRRLLTLEMELQPAHLASLLYSHARVAVADRALLGKLIKTAQRRLIDEVDGLSADDLATTLQAFATLRAEHSTAAGMLARKAVDLLDSGAPLAALCAALNGFTRLGAPCDDFRRALASCCGKRTEALSGLPARELVMLLHGLGGDSWAMEACNAVAQLLGKEGNLHNLGETGGPKALVQAMDAFARAAHVGPPLPTLTAEVTARMVDFSVVDVATVAAACQRLQAVDEGLLEAAARQALRKGWRCRPRHAQAVLDACAAAGFEHAVLDELRAGIAAADGVDKDPTAAVRGGTSVAERDSDEGSGLPLEERPFFEEPLIFARGKLPVEADTIAGTSRHVAEKDAPRLPAEPVVHPMEGLFEGGVEPLPRLARPLREREEDPRLRRLLRGVERHVLQPAGIRCARTPSAGRRRRASAPEEAGD